MTPKRGPLTATILYGLFGAAAFVPSIMAMGWVLKWPLPYNLTVWSLLAGYSLILGRMGGQGLKPVVAPLAALLAGALIINDRSVVLAIHLAGLIWLRSGLLRPGRALVKIAAEILTACGGAAMVAWFNPATPLALALSVWLFFLIQSLYFFMVEDVQGSSAREPAFKTDPFEQARRRAEAMLSDLS